MKGLYVLAQTDLQMAKNNLVLMQNMQDDVVITEWATGTRYDSSFVTSKRQLLKVMECLEKWFEAIKEQIEK